MAWGRRTYRISEAKPGTFVFARRPVSACKLLIPGTGGVNQDSVSLSRLDFRLEKMGMAQKNVPNPARENEGDL